MTHILTSSKPIERYTHTPDYELRRRYRRWATQERARRQKDDFNAMVNRHAAARVAREQAAS